MSIKSKMKFAACAVAMPVAMLAAQSAHAVLITDWKFTNLAGFTDFNPAASGADPFAVQGDAGSPSLLGAGYFEKLRWGQTTQHSNVINPALQSSLSVTEKGDIDAAPVIKTNLGFSNSIVLTHDNKPIYSFERALTDTVLRSDITLKPFLPSDLPAFPLPTSSFDIRFKETKNDKPCVTDPTTACSDVFVLVSSDFTVQGNQLVNNSSLGQIDDYIYSIVTKIEGLQVLNAAQCGLVGEAAGCVGIITKENQANAFNVQLAITARQVQIPEPGVIGLLGAALTGVGFAGNRRRKSSK